jgi:hypothetical protein
MEQGRSKHMRRTGLRFLAMAVSVTVPVVMLAQNVAGTLVAADTGAPIGHATVVAVPKAQPAAGRATVYKTPVDSAGRYAMTVSVGQYQLCVYGAEPYLDPCQWGGSRVADVASSAAVSAAASSPLSLQKGVQLILRVHDPKGLVGQAESVHGGAVRAYVSGAGAAQVPLNMISDTGGIRDYAMFIPFNSPMTVFVSGHSLLLTDKAGAALSSQGIPIQVSPADFQMQPLSPPSLARMFPRPTSKVVHVYAGGPQ